MRSRLFARIIVSDATESTKTESTRQPIWRNLDFVKLWLGHTVSMFGSQLSFVAIPLIAAVTLQATPSQMALLQVLNYVPTTVVALFAGVVVDRLRRRPLMIATDLISAAVLLIFPLAWFLGVLRLELLYGLVFALGVLGVFYGLADGAFLPVLLRREQLPEGWSALNTSSTVARIAGPGLAGLMLQWLSAPLVLAFDAATFVMSAIANGRIRQPEPTPAGTHRATVWREIQEGLHEVWRNPYLRGFQATTMAYDIFWNALYAVYILYVTRTLGLPPVAVGTIFAVGSVGALIGSATAVLVTRRLGLGRTLVTMQIINGVCALAIASAVRLPSVALAVLIGTELLQSYVNTVFGINRGSISQAATPDRLRGRVGASVSFLGISVAALGSALGGLLGETVGVVMTISACAVGCMLAFLWLLNTPIRRLKAVPVAVEG